MRRAIQSILIVALAGLAVAQSANTASAASSDSYVIGTEDVVSVNVWKEPEVSRSVPVRPDGRIALPLGGEFQAAGLTARQLEENIAKKLQSIIQNPQVTVIVQEIKSKKFNVMGEVNRPGSYPLQGETTVIDAVALAGGLRDFAKPKKMYILRQGADGKTTRIPINYKDVIAGKVEDTVKLQAKDTVVVP